MDFANSSSGSGNVCRVDARAKFVLNFVTRRVPVTTTAGQAKASVKVVVIYKFERHTLYTDKLRLLRWHCGYLSDHCALRMICSRQ
jgi:hypothetical protein